MTQLRKQTNIQQEIYRRAVLEAFRKLAPRSMVRNPVMFVVEVGSVLTSALFLQAIFGQGEATPGFIGAVSLWLWITVLFANFSEAVAEDVARPRPKPCAARAGRHRPRNCTSPSMARRWKSSLPRRCGRTMCF